MIVSRLKNFAFCNTEKSKNIETALSWLLSTDLEKLPLGRQEIDGNNVFAFVSSYETKFVKERQYQYHEKYIDLQYLRSGLERIYVIPREQMVMTVPYVDTKDIAFGMAQFPPSLVLMGPGIIAQFNPHDAHMTSINIGNERGTVEKIVVKVKVD